MADNILKLRVESSDYDAKLKNAAQGIRHLADVAHKGAGELTGLEKSELDYIRALGEMETKSRTASGQVRELSSTYKELKAVYNQLNAVEKADEGGKALAASLEKLKQRALDAKQEMNAINAELGETSKASNSTGSFVDALTQKLTINFDALTMLDKGLGMVNKGLDVAKEAFFSSEANVDAWGRTIASNESLYRSFLTTLNNSDISGFLGRIDQIIDAARKAYNELDRLGTMKTIQGPAVSAQQTENERMRMMIQTGRYIAPVDGRRASMANGTMLTPEQIRSIEQKLQQGMTKIVSLTSNEVKQTGRAIDAVYNRMAKENNMSMREFRKGTSSMAEFDKRMKGYEQYQKYEREHTMTSNRYNPQTGTYDTFTYRDQTKNPYQQYRNWGSFRVDAMGKGSYNELVDLIRQRDQQAAQAYGMQSQAFRTMNRAEGMTVSKIMRGETAGATGGGSGRGGGKGDKTTVKELTEEQKLQQQINDLVQQGLKMDEEGRAAQRVKIAALQDQLQTYKDIENELRGVTKQEAKPELSNTDKFKSGAMNMDTLGAFTSGLKSELRNADLGSDTYNSIFSKIADASLVSNMLTEAMTSGVQGANLEKVSQELKDKLLAGSTFNAESIQAMLNQINQYITDSGFKLVFDVETGKIKKQMDDVTTDIMKQKEAWNKTGMAMGIVSQAFNSIQDPAAKIMGTVAQAIANVALAYSDAMAKDQTTKFNLFAFIAAASAATIGMISTIASIHSATGYAEGGLIKGNTYSGDNIMANGGAIGLNAGELVLNKSQQYNLASQLEGDGGQSTTPSRPYVSGEQIYLGLNNYLRRSGRGEIVTSR